MSDWQDYCRRWHLIPDGPERITPRARLYPVRRNGEAAILKIASLGSDEHQAVHALTHFAGHGGARVLAQSSEAILLERAIPGVPLTELVSAGRDDDATAVIADTIRTLHHGDPPEGWPTVEGWGEGFRRQRRRGAHRLMPAGLLDHAEGIFRDLAASQSRRYLLHGDLHHDNILSDSRHGWLVIDPKGVIGEAAYETVMSLRNPFRLSPFPADPEVMSRRIAIYVERLGFDRQRVTGWAFAHLVLATCWHIEDGDPEEDVARSLAIAEAARSLLPSALRVGTRGTTSGPMNEPLDCLKLAAVDEEDLAVISAHVQDAVLKVRDLVYLPGDRRFAVGMNRFIWERAADGKRQDYERRRAALIFDRVRGVRTSHIDRNDADAVLELLAVGFEAGEAPAGHVLLVFAGGGAVRIEVECIEARLADLGAAWTTKAKPSHDLASDEANSSG